MRGWGCAMGMVPAGRLVDGLGGAWGCGRFGCGGVVGVAA